MNYGPMSILYVDNVSRARSKKCNHEFVNNAYMHRQRSKKIVEIKFKNNLFRTLIEYVASVFQEYTMNFNCFDFLKHKSPIFFSFSTVKQ